MTATRVTRGFDNNPVEIWQPNIKFINHRSPQLLQASMRKLPKKSAISGDVLKSIQLHIDIAVLRSLVNLATTIDSLTAAVARTL